MSEAWVTVAISDIYPYKDARAFDDEHTNRFTKTMQNVCDIVRGKIKSCPSNQVSATAYTVPPELKWVACVLIVEGLLTGIPGLEIDDQDKTRFRRAYDTLDQVMRCEFKITQPEDAVALDVGTQPPMVVITKSERTATRELMNGL